MPSLHESTFAANLNVSWSHYTKFYNSNEREFLKLNYGIFESEEIINAIYKIYMALLAKGWVGTKSAGIGGVGEAYLNGFYLPCIERVVLTGQVDTLNDPLPDYAGLVVFGNGEQPAFESLVKVAKPPRGWITLPGCSTYAVTHIFQQDAVDRANRKVLLGKDDILEFHTHYVGIHRDGRVLPCRLSLRGNETSGMDASMHGLFCQAAAVALNTWSDKRHLWLVETTEAVLKSLKTPLSLGVSAEHVKSLFYARETPLTETGRKRPILHWVRAHQRRLREGIEIDISRFLRGITEFEMAGFPFRITQPVKQGSQ